MEDIKQVVSALIREFESEERGNKITSNNMMGLHTKLLAALDGKITLQKPEKE